MQKDILRVTPDTASDKGMGFLVPRIGSRVERVSECFPSILNETLQSVCYR